jgi:hypothetical protein
MGLITRSNLAQASPSQPKPAQASPSQPKPAPKLALEMLKCQFLKMLVSYDNFCPIANFDRFFQFGNFPCDYRSDCVTKLFQGVPLAKTADSYFRGSLSLGRK